MQIISGDLSFDISLNVIRIARQLCELISFDDKSNAPASVGFVRGMQMQIFTFPRGNVIKIDRFCLMKCISLMHNIYRNLHNP